MSNQSIPEILLIDKPKGITSFDVIRRLRKEYKEYGCRSRFFSVIRGAHEVCEGGVCNYTLTEETNDATKKRTDNKLRMGHAGTLDPLATGLMIVGIGAGTKKLNDYIKLDKEYIAEILIGERRSTGDMEGVVLEEKEVRNLEKEEVIEALANMVGVLRLSVSSYSAIKKNGVPMYKRARKAERKGETIEDLPERDMEVFESELVRLKCDGKRCVATVRFHVGSGTYIRSLAEDLGRRLGYPATIQNLRRTKIGHWSVEEAQGLN